MSKILAGKKGLVVGIANDHSIAWGIAKSLSDEGASMYLTYQNDSIKKRVENVSDVLSEGQEVQVKVLDVDRAGKVKLSMREV